MINLSKYFATATSNICDTKFAGPSPTWVSHHHEGNRVTSPNSRVELHKSLQLDRLEKRCATDGHDPRPAVIDARNGSQPIALRLIIN